MKRIYPTTFPLFQSHLDLAHHYWQELVEPGDTIIDATCGNGHDALALAEIALQPATGHLYAMDLQPIALQHTQTLLHAKLAPEVYSRVTFIQQCHSVFPDTIPPESIRLIVYNLGYLPGGDKTLTTLTETTLRSLQNALPLLMSGGCISLTAYPGHAEGEREESELLAFVSRLDPKRWNTCLHRWINRERAPSLCLIQRAV